MTAAEPQLGQRIRDCRVSRGMRRRELATAIGKSYDLVAGIENGHTRGAPETLVAIARALGVPVSKAMAGDWSVES